MEAFNPDSANSSSSSLRFDLPGVSSQSRVSPRSILCLLYALERFVVVVGVVPPDPLIAEIDRGPEPVRRLPASIARRVLTLPVLLVDASRITERIERRCRPVSRGEARTGGVGGSCVGGAVRIRPWRGFFPGLIDLEVVLVGIELFSTSGRVSPEHGTGVGCVVAGTREFQDAPGSSRAEAHAAKLVGTDPFLVYSRPVTRERPPVAVVSRQESAQPVDLSDEKRRVGSSELRRRLRPGSAGTGCAQGRPLGQASLLSTLWPGRASERAESLGRRVTRRTG